mmetsp:Transcript_33363/g.46564  ORF Transcript_33363/g.46564 Transcript_33363/m.46564 type:complete len:268 (+) Transcript_33363:121-924(+)
MHFSPSDTNLYLSSSVCPSSHCCIPSSRSSQLLLSGNFSPEAVGRNSLLPASASENPRVLDESLSPSPSSSSPAVSSGASIFPFFSLLPLHESSGAARGGARAPKLLSNAPSLIFWLPPPFSLVCLGFGSLGISTSDSSSGKIGLLPSSSVCTWPDGELSDRVSSAARFARIRSALCALRLISAYFLSYAARSALSCKKAWVCFRALSMSMTSSQPVNAIFERSSGSVVLESSDPLSPPSIIFLERTSSWSIRSDSPSNASSGGGEK